MASLERITRLLDRVLPAGDAVRLGGAIAGGGEGVERLWVFDEGGWVMLNLHLVWWLIDDENGSRQIEDVYEQRVYFLPSDSLSSPILDEFVLSWGAALAQRLSEACPRRFMPYQLMPSDPYAIVRGRIQSSDDLAKATAIGRLTLEER